jgi:Flp pilus assembly pilin Flp
VQNFLKNDCGDSAIEYGLLVALIGTSIAIAVMLLGGVLK